MLRITQNVTEHAEIQTPVAELPLNSPKEEKQVGATYDSRLDELPFKYGKRI